MNQSIYELADSLILYGDFISDMQQKYGIDGYVDLKYNIQDIDHLRKKFLQLNPEFEKQLEFWKSDLECQAEQLHSN